MRYKNVVVFNMSDGGVGDFHCHFNGDFSGDVLIERDGFPTISVPYQIMQELVTMSIREKMIASLEQTKSSEIIELSAELLGLVAKGAV